LSAVLAIVGPTASGKSDLALAIARRHVGVEVVAADAMQVYRGMDIGTAKPTAAEQEEIRHHLVDVADPDDDFSLARYVELGRAALVDIEARGGRAVIVGGTGLYVRGLVDDFEVPGQWPAVRDELEGDPDTEALHRRLADLDPVAASRMEPGNRRRIVRALEVTVGSGRRFSSFGPGMAAYPPVATLQIGLEWPLDELDRRIETRVQAMVDRGLVDEVSRLAGAPRGLSRTARQALGYREVLEHLDGACSLDEAVATTVARTRRFARRQVRWFRRDPRVVWRDGRIAPDELARSVNL
jgi:tRNA dimethylallyltransferase